MGIHYLQMALVQFAIQIVFDLFPLSIVLIGNPMSATKRNTNWISAYAMKTKIECVNGMNGWTATDQSVRPFMWWTTLVIAGYFCFFLLLSATIFMCCSAGGRERLCFWRLDVCS